MKCDAPNCERAARSRFKDGPNVCGMHYQRLLKHGAYDNPPRAVSEWATCTVAECDNPARTRQGRRCEKHYCRQHRTGSTDDPEYGRKFVASHGYVISYSPSHPVANKSGVLYEHRRVLFDKIGGGSHPCHWCKGPVSWGVRRGKTKLVVDHLDNDKENNSDDNLVPACHSCNTSRGLFANWAIKHKDDPFLTRLFLAANDNKPTLKCEAV